MTVTLATRSRIIGKIALCLLCTVTSQLVMAQDGSISIVGGAASEQPDLLMSSIYINDAGDLSVRDLSDGELLVTEKAGDAVAITESVPLSAAFQVETVNPWMFIRRASNSGVLRYEDDANSELTVIAARDNELIRAIYLAKRRDLEFVLQEELVKGAKPVIRVERYVTVFRNRRELVDERTALDTGSAEFENDDYVAIGKNGRMIYSLSVVGGKAGIKSIEVGGDAGTSSPQALSLPQGEVQPEFDAAFEQRVRVLSGANQGLAVPQQKSREQILATADSYLTVQWQFMDSNASNDHFISRCDVPASIWRLPPRLNNQQGRQVSAVPYKWGGYMSLDEFLAMQAQGHLTGDVCTCRDASFNYCIVEEAVGVDCSGFVSQSWGVPYHTTSRLHLISDPIDASELKPGDILVKPGSHVRLYLGPGEDPYADYKIIESAVSCGGVCKQSLPKSRFGGYEPRRLKHLD